MDYIQLTFIHGHSTWKCICKMCHLKSYHREIKYM